MRLLFQHEPRAPRRIALLTLIALLSATVFGVGILGVTAWSQSEAALSFGVGQGIQMVDPAGQNGVPLWLPPGETTVDFALYALSDDALLARVQSVNAPPVWGEPVLYDVTGLPRVRAWQATLNAVEPYAPVTVTLPADVPHGAYILEGTHAGDRATVMVSVGTTALLARRGVDGTYLLWAAQLQTGAPVAGMEITLYDAAGTSLSSGVTDASGRVRLQPAAGTPATAIGHTATDSAVLGLTSAWFSLDNTWWTPDSWAPDAHRVYLYTDRPIYRPGQTVHYNAIVRAVTGDGYAPPAADAAVTVTLYDARNNTVAVQSPTLDELGAVHGEFVLADEPPLGTYRLELDIAGTRVAQTLDVAAYTKPEYAVEVTTPDATAIAGDVIPVAVRADYFFGQPVAAAAIKLQIYRTPIFGGYGYYGDDIWWPGPGGWETLVDEETGITDADGTWSLDYPLPADDAGANWSYRFVAAVTDARNTPIEGSVNVAVYWSELQLDVTTPRYGYAAGTPVDMTIRARDRAGAPLAAQEVTLRLNRGWEETLPDIVRPVTTGADGAATTTFTDLPQGWYRVIATSTDARGRSSTVESYLWIYGAGEDWWWSSDNSITLALDRDEYAPGETATVLIQSRVAGTGLLTVQRDTVISEQVVTLTGPVTAVELPVTPAMTPNAHLVFHMFQPTADDAVFRREGKLVTGRTELRAPSTQNFLTVDVSADRAQYRPRDVARLTINLTDHAGQPQAGQVSVAVVDEAIFALAADRSGSILDAFYAPGPDRTSLYDSLIRNPDYYYGYPEVDGETPAPSPTATPGPLEPDASLDATAPDVRRLFLDTAYWNATVAVDASGRATVDVPLPDNLTTWRVVVKAVTGATQVGEAQGQLLVTQALVARPILPRFAVVGDQFRAGVIGQNFTGADVSGAATLAGAGLHLLDGDARALTIPDGGSAIATWNVVAAEVGTAPVQTTVTTPAGGDAVELPLPVKPFAVPARDVMAGQANPRAQEAFTLPLNAVNDATALTVRLTPSLALGVLDGLDELIDYPYGCVEQTMSRVLPTAAAAQVYRELGLDNPKAAELPAIVNEGLQRLYGFQHDDGGWGWFFDDEGSIYTTAYVLFGLTAVQQSGFDVDADVLARGFAALAQRYPEMNHAGMQAFVQYVLAYAGQGDLAAARALLARAGELDAAGLATLALTFDLVGAGDEAQPLVDRLLTLARSTSTTAYWPAVETWDEFHWRMMTSEDKNTALAVAALARLRPDDARLPKAVRWLMEHRRGAGWSNTQATAFAVLGLLDAIKARGELAADYAYRVELNGAPVLTGRVTPENVTTPIAPLVIPGADLAPGANTLAIVREDDAVGAAASDTRPEFRQAAAPLYYSAVLDQQLYFDAFAPVASAGGGINVTRRYELIEGTPRPDGAYDLGDVVQVTLDIELAEEMYYVMVQDPIPAGFDVISERENLSGWSEFGMPFFWRDRGYNRKEVRDDRVDFFLTQGWAGEHTLTYTMRATLPGTFSVLPTSVFPMYADQFWGRSASAQVTVAPEQLTPRPALAGDIDHSCTISNFDVQLVAAAWPHAVPDRDVVADGVVDLRDVAAVAARRGAACSADLPLPETAGDTVTLGLAGPDATQVIGDEFVVTVRRAAAGVVDGVALQLAYDPTLLRPVRVQWADGTSILPLGPVVDAAQGRLLFGGYNLEPSSRGAASTGAADDVLAEVVFAGIRVGAAEVRLTAGQVADDAGRIHNAAGAAVARVRIEGEQTFLPMIQGD